MAKKIGISVVVLIAILVIFIATRPAAFHIERSAQVDAPPEAVFPLINDFHQWAKWSPFEKLDPDMKKTFEGAEAGPGAIYTWSGNSSAGVGRMTIEESKPGERVDIKLEFTKPMKATNQAIFTLKPTESGTRVTWSMDGNNGFMGKAVTLFMNMDSMVGTQFEEGLANLNTAAKATAQDAAPPVKETPAADAAASDDAAETSPAAR